MLEECTDRLRDTYRPGSAPSRGVTEGPTRANPNERPLDVGEYRTISGLRCQRRVTARVSISLSGVVWLGRALDVDDLRSSPGFGARIS
jgi:hypothetical protein